MHMINQWTTSPLKNRCLYIIHIHVHTYHIHVALHWKVKIYNTHSYIYTVSSPHIHPHTTPPHTFTLHFLTLSHYTPSHPHTTPPHTFTLHSLTPSQDNSEGYPQLDIDDVLKIEESLREEKLRVSHWSLDGFMCPSRCQSVSKLCFLVLNSVTLSLLLSPTVILRCILLRGLTSYTVVHCSECEWMCM